ncbi:hypothetical protein OAQ99_03165 [Candidatus Kapabacteria bacterium]|nr:hypothetical protein [Candidatus Kapabacteria bacterium]
MKKETFYKLLLFMSFILFGLVLRNIPSIPNFSSFIALTLFSGILFPKNKLAYLLPFAIQMMMDLFIGIYATDLVGYATHFITMYLSLGLIVFIGQKSTNINFLKSLVGVTVANIGFFIITNFGSWILLPQYDASINGLISSYLAALPFFKNSIISGLVFSSILFGIYKFYELKVNNTEKEMA